MPDPISGQIAAGAGGVEQPGQTPSTPPQQGSADPEDVSKFEQALSGGQPEGTPEPSAMQGVNEAQQAEGADKITGEDMIEKLNKIGEGMQADGKEIMDALNDGDLKPEDLIRLNLKTAKVMMDQTIIGKGGEKGGQSIQTLMRGQ